MLIQELCHRVSAKGVGDAAVVVPPALNILQTQQLSISASCHTSICFDMMPQCCDDSHMCGIHAYLDSPGLHKTTETFHAQQILSADCSVERHPCATQHLLGWSLQGRADGFDLVRIGPEQVAQEAGVWHVCRSCHSSDLIQVLELRRQAAMHAKNLQASSTNAMSAAGVRCRPAGCCHWLFACT